MQYLFGKCLKPLTIQYLLTGLARTDVIVHSLSISVYIDGGTGWAPILYTLSTDGGALVVYLIEFVSSSRTHRSNVGSELA